MQWSGFLLVAIRVAHVQHIQALVQLFLGEVVAVNEALADDPAQVNSDPYGEGWLIELRPENADDVAKLLSAEAYQAELD